MNKRILSILLVLLFPLSTYAVVFFGEATLALVAILPTPASSLPNPLVHIHSTVSGKSTPTILMSNFIIPNYSNI